jgi:hypothetical protein
LLVADFPQMNFYPNASGIDFGPAFVVEKSVQRFYGHLGFWTLVRPVELSIGCSFT